MGNKSLIVPYVCIDLVPYIKSATSVTFKIKYAHRDDYKSGMAEYWLDDVPKQQLGMLQDLAHWIQINCVCIFCGEEISDDLSPCGCGNNNDPFVQVGFSYTKDWENEELLITRIGDSEFYETAFSKLWRLNRERLHRVAKQARRQGQIAQSRKRSTMQEKRSLLEVQKYRCFYCGVRLHAESGHANYHFDHYISLANGGTDDIENIVCACTECNMKKNSENGPQFSSKITRCLDLQTKAEVRKIRARVRVYKNSKRL